MSRLLSLAPLTVVLLAGSTLLASPPAQGQEPRMTQGMGLYRARCADCHGIDARGVRGPDLTLPGITARTDEELFRIIRGGVAGTEMPGNTVDPDEGIHAIVRYLRSLAPSPPPDTARGDAAAGRTLFERHCAGCHAVQGRGGRLGPDLTRITATRSRAALIGKIRDSRSFIAPGWSPITVVTARGETVSGIRKNEDAFSLQMLDSAQRLRSFDKAALTSIAAAPSPMPNYGPAELSDRDLDNLLAFLHDAATS